MAPQKRQPNTSLKDRLFKEFYTFSFFKAVNVLESLYPDKEPLGRTLEPHKEAIRFSVKPGFGFPPSDISNLKHENKIDPVEMEVAFMGMIGPSGILPDWYNELAIERIRRKDFSFSAFLDIFHHRLISLFYLAWKKHRYTVNYMSGAKDRLSQYLLSLAGLGTPGLYGRIGLPEESLIYYSGLLSRAVPSAVAIESTLEYFAGTAVEVQQFIDRMLLLSPEDQTQIGVANGRLGINTVCGSYVWENQSRFRVNLGPMGYGDFLRFLPSGDMLRPIFSLVRYMVGIEFEFEIRLFLKRKEIPPCILGAKTPTAPRLGLSTWIKHPDIVPAEDPNVTFQEAQALKKMD
ncbi:MAG: type VI secretion system baseplate subunit TssG [Desulfobacterales bacterium]|nr:type VI secretion system baseplate subunit TssG [Desulfobacterales bacterium]